MSRLCRLRNFKHGEDGQWAYREITTLRRELAEARQEIADRKADCETGHDQDEKTIAELRQQLAASQAREQLSLDALNVYADAWDRHWKPGMPILQPLSDHVFSLPKDTTALSAMIAKAGEVMRERCLNRPHPPYADCLANGFIRALPGVTLEDLK